MSHETIFYLSAIFFQNPIHLVRSTSYFVVDPRECNSEWVRTQDAGYWVSSGEIFSVFLYRSPEMNGL